MTNKTKKSFAKISKATAFIGMVAGASFSSGCTSQIPNSFRLSQQEQAFGAQIDINTKIDLLWVVDNSSSMNTAQDKLRQGLAGFASTYMQPTWDIQVAVITTDTYMANPAFTNYLNTTISGTTGWTSSYVQGRLGTFVNPPHNATLVNLSTGVFTNGVKNKDLMPAWGPDFAKLLTGYHDGPVAAFCFEGQPYFMNGAANCAKRDNQITYNGNSKCLNPVAASGETADNMCQNTIVNNTVRSGKPIIRTMPTTTLTGAALTAWTNQLADDFKINITTGSSGHGSERGLGSVIQMLQDNETTGSSSKFFRQGALRGIIFVSDEDDQTMTIASGSQISPNEGYMCDQASLLTMNAAATITGANGYCCTGAGCRYGSEGLSCPSKVIDGITVTPSLCPNPSKLVSVSSVKTQIDNFFKTLDGTTDPNYFVASITPTTAASILDLQSKRDTDDAAAGAHRSKGIDRGDRYIELGNLVGNGSLSLDIGSSNYSTLLDSIGQAIIQKKSTFTLSRAPTAQEDMMIILVRANGSRSVIGNDKYTISGKNVVITDQALVLSFAANDQLIINYQPRSMN